VIEVVRWWAFNRLFSFDLLRFLAVSRHAETLIPGTGGP